MTTPARKPITSTALGLKLTWKRNWRKDIYTDHAGRSFLIIRSRRGFTVTESGTSCSDTFRTVNSAVLHIHGMVA